MLNNLIVLSLPPDASRPVLAEYERAVTLLVCAEISWVQLRPGKRREKEERWEIDGNRKRKRGENREKDKRKKKEERVMRKTWEKGNRKTHPQTHQHTPRTQTKPQTQNYILHALQYNNSIATHTDTSTYTSHTLASTDTYYMLYNIIFHRLSHINLTRVHILYALEHNKSIITHLSTEWRHPGLSPPHTLPSSRRGLWPWQRHPRHGIREIHSTPPCK